MPRLATTTTRILLAVGAILLMTSSPALADDSKLTAAKIVEKATDRNSLGSFEAGNAQLTLVIKDKSGSSKSKGLDIKTKKIDGAMRSRITLTAPKEVKGQTFLFAENKKGEDDVWMHLPAFGATRRIAGAQKKGSFLGSHFSYRDLESRDAKDSTYNRLKDETIGKNKVYVIDATPKDPKNSDYGKVTLYIRSKDFIPLKVKYFDKAGKLDKTMFTEKLNKTKEGETYVERMTVHAKKGGSTTIVIKALDGETEIPDTVFRKDQLGK